MVRSLNARRRSAGFSLVELIITLMIIAPILIYIAHEYIQRNADRFQAVAADQMAQFANGLNTYVSANNATLAACATTTVACSVTVAQLQAANDLPNTFATTNVYGQTYLAAVLKDTSGNLLPLAVTTGGTTIPDNDVRNIAAKVTTAGAEGGYISINTPTIAQGAYGSWGNGVTVTQWGFAPGGGHIADALFVRNAAIADDYLHRHATAGQPQLNQMNTAIDMTGNPLNNVSVLNIPGGGNGINLGGSYLYGDSSNLATRSPTGNLYVQSLAGGSGSIVQVHNINGDGSSTFTANNVSAASTLWAGSAVNTNGNMLANGSISSGGDMVSNGAVYSSNWFRSYGNTGWYSQTYGGGWFMQDTSWIRAYGNKGIYTAGQIQGGTVVSNGRLTANEYAQINGTAAQGGGCSPDGMIARANTGSGLIQCKGGVWSGFGAYTQFMIVQGTGTNGFTNSTATCPGGWTMLSGGGRIAVNPYSFLPGYQSFPANATTWVTSTTDSRVWAVAYAFCGK